MQTTKDIIKILPFKQEFKDNLLNDYDQLTADQRFSIERLVWDLYDAIYESRLEENMQKAFERAKKNEEKLDHEFYERIRKQTEMEFEKESGNVATSVDLSSAREELSKIINNQPHPKHQAKSAN